MYNRIRRFYRSPSLAELLDAYRDGYTHVKTPHLGTTEIDTVIDCLGVDG